MQFIILGCGSSMGVPRADGDFGNCNPRIKKNYRTRCSALIKGKSKNILIDTSPDLRTQLIKNKINNIDVVLYSHMHADQTHGINDLRVFYIKNKKTIPVFADTATSNYLSKTFGYCFKKTFNEYPPILNLNKIKKKMYFSDIDNKILIETINVKHGKVNSICYIIEKKVAYISDVSEIAKKDYYHFKNLKYLIIDCLWYERKHSSHLNLGQALELIDIFKPNKAILTNLHSEIDYDKLKKRLPKNTTPAFDGLTINF
jgi:phosphoribosyl 1,2-cyclic phosphate phosphodiesterase